MASIFYPSPPSAVSATDEAAQGVWIEGPELFSADFEAEWDRLAHKASSPNPFFESWFLKPSLDRLSRDRSLRVFAVRQGDNLLGLLPIARALDYYGKPLPHCASWRHNNAFCAMPLVARGAERAFWERLLNDLDQQALGAAFLHLPLLDRDTTLFRALEELCAAQDRPIARVAEHTRAMLRAENSSADYLANATSAKKRKEWRRQRKRLSESGKLTVERWRDARALGPWIDEFLALERAGWKGRSGSALASDPSLAGLFRDALEGAAQRGRLERLALRLDGRAIAMLVNFHTPPAAYSFKTAFDENLAPFSPGVLLQLENLALADDPDIDWCDSCAAQGHPMIERIWREKRRMVSCNVAIGGQLRRALFRQLMKFETRKGATP